MAKPPGERTKLIRQPITDHPGVGNTELATLLNGKKPGHDFKAQDFAQQRQAMKNLESKGTAEDEKAADKGSKKDEARPKGPATKTATAEEVTSGLTADDLAVLRSLVRKVGNVDTLIRYLELLRDIR
jgi:hypothetical protein